MPVSRQLARAVSLSRALDLGVELLTIVVMRASAGGEARIDEGYDPEEEEGEEGEDQHQRMSVESVDDEQHQHEQQGMQRIE